MLFKQWQQVLDSQKTQTRRLVKEGEFAVNQHGNPIPDRVWGNEIDAVYSPKGFLKWQVYHTYAIQPRRGKKAVGRFLLLAIRRELLQQISEVDAEAEGCRVPVRHFIWGRTARRKFACLWDSIHTKPGTMYTDDPEVWVLALRAVA